LANIREVDAIAHVLRCFEDPDIVHVEGRIDPVADAETVETELMLADTTAWSGGSWRCEKAAAKEQESPRSALPVMEQALNCWQAGKPVASYRRDLAPDKLKLLAR
jgi:ribosome-binding ATPase YchF (GTP1/OBG family)